MSKWYFVRNWSHQNLVDDTKTFYCLLLLMPWPTFYGNTKYSFFPLVMELLALFFRFIRPMYEFYFRLFSLKILLQTSGQFSNDSSLASSLEWSLIYAPLHPSLSHRLCMSPWKCCLNVPLEPCPTAAEMAAAAVLQPQLNTADVWFMHTLQTNALQAVGIQFSPLRCALIFIQTSQTSTSLSHPYTLTYLSLPFYFHVSSFQIWSPSPWSSSLLLQLRASTQA